MNDRRKAQKNSKKSLSFAMNSKQVVCGHISEGCSIYWVIKLAQRFHRTIRIVFSLIVMTLDPIRGSLGTAISKNTEH